jgi:hypothetical protein
MTPATVKTYLSYLAKLHKLKNLDESCCKNFISKLLLRGAENLSFYQLSELKPRFVMTLPLLRILGHELCKSNWSTYSKSVIWAAFCTAFFGSFRFGELLSKQEKKFNPHETLLWSDIFFLDDNSAKIHNKIPKNRQEGGETISLFEFNKYNCCPIAALKKLKKISKFSDQSPVFTFENGTFLTNKRLNSIIQFFLSNKIGKDASNYTCHSFRAALPSALATDPSLNSSSHNRVWGRWQSDALERYTRLSHIAKKAVFADFVKALMKVK